MSLIGKSILLISPESWGANHVSKHHYAKALSSLGNKVFFLNSPGRAFSSKEIMNKLWVLSYFPIAKGLRHLPEWISAYLIKWEIQRLEKHIGTRFDIIWNFDSSRFFNLKAVKNRLRICHIVDMAENIQRPLLSKSADICFCTSDFIAKELKYYNEKVFKINHGYQMPSASVSIKETFDKSKIQVGYVGNLARSCIQWKTMNLLIESYPEIQFNFIGSHATSNLSANNLAYDQLSFLQTSKNVCLLGEKESNLIPAYLKCFDVLLSIYTVDNLEQIKQHSNLHKTMEYLGSGKVIISSYSDEYKDKAYLLEMVTTNKELPAKFKEAISNLAHFNSPKKQAERKSFALENTYVKKILQIEKLIEKHVGK